MPDSAINTTGSNRLIAWNVRRETMNGNEIIFLVQDSLEGGYEARALGYSIFTEADTLDELREMVRDAVACHFEEDTGPAVIRLHFVKEEVLAA